MNKLQLPFRYDYVGSFLRPAPLKQAREDYKNKKITQNQLTEIENKEITALITKQKAAGYHVITDGEFRRSYWHLDFMWGFNGIDAIELNHGYFFHDEETTPGSIRLTGKIDGKNHPFVEHFKFVKQFEDENTVAKQTLPAPAQLLAELFREDNAAYTKSIYPNLEDLIQDIVQAYHTVLHDLFTAGCHNVQFDDCTWGMFCDTKYWSARQNSNISLENEAKKYLRINNLVINGNPQSLTLTTHVCRGNYHSTWASSGGYAPIAPFLFANEDAAAFYLEFDDERSGNFEPLQYVPANKKVVLGLITTKSPQLEDKASVIARIHEAEKYIPLDRLYLSPQCGFASCEIGNQLTEAEQWAKLALVKQIAETVW
ncbi:5-methyltetrahydropteroyltriglutamate--homocysteine S-methyltransferase [Pectinatus frisingensis]|uniref:5-methyltetrahydropteroyltriglutamate-- homocysteine S-methyltransferase n=1 Tax=Pectinatus frisingensis TaxID=865 RepID=UPI0018C830EE|nr:5-methyltetrahydropteroyltriglutamate--homocysteine S-methyltransferase [Pectinatus frisingensis]